MKTLRQLNQDWILATEIHKLEARLWRLAQKRGVKIVVISSAMRGDGKSTTLANLVTALALHPDRKILAVDLDFREPKMNSHFDLNVSTPLGSVLRGEAEFGQALIKCTLPNLDLLMPHPEGEDPAILLETLRLPELAEFARANYDLTLIDVPALVPVADASAVLPYTDGVVLMAMAGKTTKAHLTRAREICLGMDAEILGLIVGNVQEGLTGYQQDAYYFSYRKPSSRDELDANSPPAD